MKISNNVKTSAHMKYHLDNDISIAKNVFRYCSSAWAELICEARQLYLTGFVLELDEDEYYIFEKDTGEIAEFENSKVLLDAPEPMIDKPGFFVVYTKNNNNISKIIF